MRERNVSAMIRRKIKIYFDHCCNVGNDEFYKFLLRVWKSSIHGVIERGCIVIASNGKHINSCGQQSSGFVFSKLLSQLPANSCKVQSLSSQINHQSSISFRQSSSPSTCKVDSITV
ncbi:hypothetical protein V8G54_001016 [Vigna mungo]|uniref:Uncharacterized protein n=1 Tax=Vigna mungo TaxID=3915 RepID=A0AAQ3S9H7_VIGMU